MNTIVIPVDAGTKKDIKLAAAKLKLTVAAYCRMVILEKINKNGG